jgi:hypothetical protein
MRTIALYIVLGTFFPVGLFSQNLQLSQVKLVDTNVQTVPDGKVWKVESALPSKAVTVDQPFAIEVNGQEVFVSTYSAGVKYWDNISSIHFEMRFRNESGSCSGGCGTHLQFTHSGTENGLPYSNRSWSGSIVTTSQTSYATQFTVVPQVGTAFSITSFRLWTTSNGSCQIPTKIRMTVTYGDGSSQVTEYDGGVCASNSSSDVLGTSSAPVQVLAASRDFFTAAAKFPFWLPEGATLKAGANVRFLSVLEFDLTD